MKKVFVYLTTALLLSACGSSPYQKGMKLAAKYDACVDDYFKALDQVGEDFAGQLPGKYTSRTKAMEDYLQLLQECHQKYMEKWGKIYSEEQQMRKKMKTSTDKVEFETGIQTDRDCYTFASVPDLETMDISASVLQQVRKIIPPKPDAAQITLDLVGHSLSEGKEDGYYPQSWTWKISEGGVSDLKVISTKENTNSRYTINVTMRLSSETRAYDAKATVSYVLDDICDWKIENVHSLGMDIVKTHRYDDCVKCYYTKGLAGGLTAENNCEIALEVAGKELTYSGKWEKFCCVVPPHTQARISWSETDFIVDYVERP